MPPLVIIFLALTGGYFSLMETAIKECRRGRIEKLADDGNEDAKAVKEILETPRPSLSVAQIGITLTGILSGICAVLCVPLISGKINFIENAEIIAIALSTVVVTFIMLLIGEFLPKRVAQQMPENILLNHHKSFSRIVKIFTPVVSIFKKFAGGTMVLIGMNEEPADSVTEDEIKDLIDRGTEDGTFEKSEREMVDRIFQMSDRTAYDLMTPRTGIVWIDLTDDIKHNLKVVKESPYTIFPVGNGSLDDCRGIIYAKDILSELLDTGKPEEMDLTKLIKKPVYVPKTMETFRLVEKFRAVGAGEAMVLDEYGGVTGFITLDDIINEIAGTAPENAGNTGISQTDKNSWIVNGLFAIDDFKEEFDIDTLPYEEEDHYRTMGGFVTSYFGYIPKVGENFEWNGMNFEILKMDRARVDKIFLRQVGEIKSNAPEKTD